MPAGVALVSLSGPALEPLLAAISRHVGTLNWDEFKLLTATQPGGMRRTLVIRRGHALYAVVAAAASLAVRAHCGGAAGDASTFALLLTEYGAPAQLKHADSHRSGQHSGLLAATPVRTVNFRLAATAADGAYQHRGATAVRGQVLRLPRYG